MRRALFAAAIAACAVPAAAAAADPRLALFPTPLAPVTSSPPFLPPPTALPNVFRPPIAGSTAVVVGVDATGKVVAVQATQRLLLRRKADYRLTIPAPASDVLPGPGSDSSPGLRQGAILWQGFSPGNRLLSARATLEPGRAASALPLAIRISGQTVRLENTTTTPTTSYTADGDEPQIAHLLDAMRKDPFGTSVGQSAYVKVTGKTEPLHLTVSAPLRVTGTVGGEPVDVVLGGGRPLVRTLHVGAEPTVHLLVDPVPPAWMLRPPRQRTWMDAVRTGAFPGGRALFTHAVEASLTLARFRQFESPLLNPDPLGKIAAHYRYRTVAAPAPPPAPPSPSEEGMAAWLIALIVAGSVAAAGGLAVLWAHS